MKKLTLKKETVSELSRNMQDGVKGGNYTDTCPVATYDGGPICQPTAICMTVDPPRTQAGGISCNVFCDTYFCG